MSKPESFSVPDFQPHDLHSFVRAIPSLRLSRTVHQEFGGYDSVYGWIPPKEKDVLEKTKDNTKKVKK